MDIPMLDMNAVRSRACLQKGIAHIPNAVMSIEKPRGEHQSAKSQDNVDADTAEDVDTSSTPAACG